MNNNQEQIIGYDAQTGQPIYVNQNNNASTQKKKKYWLFPILIFAIGILSKIIQLVVRFIYFNTEVPKILNQCLSIIFYLSMFMVIPSIIIAIVLSNKKGK